MARSEQKSEIAGRVWSVEVAPGDHVNVGDELIILESMKMEIPVTATQEGRVVQVLVREKDAVAEGQTVVLLEG